MNATATTTKIRFETAACSRCGGTGHYSFNQVSGTRCFRCRGARTTRTANGKRARAAYEALLAEHASIDAQDLKPGMLIVSAAQSAEFYLSDHEKMWRTIDTVSVADGRVSVRFTRADRFWNFAPADRVRVDSPEIRVLVPKLMAKIAKRFKGATIEEVPAPVAEAPAAPVVAPTQLSDLDKTPAPPAAPTAPADATVYAVRKGTYGPKGTVWEATRTATGADALRAALDAEGIPAESAPDLWFRRGSSAGGTVWHWSAVEPRTDTELLSAAYLMATATRQMRDGTRHTLRSRLGAVTYLSGRFAAPDRVAAAQAEVIAARDAYRSANRAASSAREAYLKLREEWLKTHLFEIPWEAQPACCR